MLLLDLFVSQNKLTEAESKEIEAALSGKDDVIVDDLLAAKNISGDDIAQVRSVLYGLSIYTEAIPENKDLTKYINVGQSKQLYAVPLELKDGILLVGVVDPEHAHVLDSLQFLFGADHQAYKVYLITLSSFREHFGIKVEAKNDAASLTDQVDGDSLIDYVTKDSEDKKDSTSEDIDLEKIEGNIDQDLAKLSIPDIFSIVLKYAIDDGASDIHVEHIGTAVRFRCRLDGQLTTIATLPPKLHPMLIARIKILCGMKLDEKRKPQDGRFSTKLGDHTVDYRVSTFPGYYGEKVVIRILDSYRGVRPLDTLGFSARQLEEVRAALAKPFGIILISGPTGSGKTTTLYAMLSELDREHRNVVSLEDPIEYNVPSMNQSQVFPEIGYTFASGLRSILRQDPDIIMVGEIRDAETAQLAIQAALTGHLVFSTIHTNTAVGVVTRLLDMGIEPYLIAPTLNVAIGQRLVRSIAEGCSVPMDMSEGIKTMLDEQFASLPENVRKALPLDQPLHEAKPSEQYPSGMKGRIPVFEVLTIDKGLQDSILHSKGEAAMWEAARTNGMLTMKEDAIIKSIGGTVPFIEINEL